jgi:hypothetical protein
MRGKGRLRVGKSLPLPLPSHTPQHYPWGFQNPCPSLPVIVVVLCVVPPADPLQLCVMDTYIFFYFLY